MKRTIDPPDDPVDFLFALALHGHARSMLDTLRLIKTEHGQHTWNNLVARDHTAGMYLPLMFDLKWLSYGVKEICIGRVYKVRWGRRRWDAEAFLELLEETYD